MSENFELHIQIESVTGGFVLTYPVVVRTDGGSSYCEMHREIFVSPTKMKKKIAELLVIIKQPFDSVETL